MINRIYHTPLGLSAKRPDVEMPAIDRRALMENAHRIATRMRPHMGSYREALAYGLKAAWAQVNVARSIMMLNAQVKRREYSAAEIAASRRATRRCGSSYMYA
jgi:hypothetical protein